MTLDGKIYKTTSEMADKWHIDSKIIAKFCRKNVIVDKKKIKNKWYI